MNKTKRKYLSLLLSFAVGFTMIFGSAGFAQATSYDKTKAIFEKCGDYIYTTVKEPTVGTLGGEWVMYGLSHAGYDMSDSYRDTYLANVEKELKEKDGILHAKAFTQYSRVIIGVTSAGADATNIAVYNIVEPLADFVNVKWLGMNSVMWALIALDSGNYEMPQLTESYRYGTLTPKETDRQNSRQRMVDYLLANQYDDGAWNILTKAEEKSGYNAVSSVDMTAMGMIALAPYSKQAKVKKALDRAISYLSKQQNQTGGFRHVNKASGGFQPVVDQMATEQAYYALAFFYQDVPAKTTLSKTAKSGSGKLKATWKKAAINTDYVTKQSGRSLSKTVTGLKKGKTYYVKVRAYKTVNGKKIYGLYSSVKTQKV